MPQTPKPAATSSALQNLAIAKVSQLRNIVDLSSLDAWLVNLGTRISNDCAVPLEDGASAPDCAARLARCLKAKEWLATVARNWMLRRGAISTYNPSSTENNGEPAWIKAALKAKKPLHRLDFPEAERVKMESILDWMTSSSGPSPNSDWSRVSVEHAFAAEQAWIDVLAKAAFKRDLDAAGTIFFCSAEESMGPGWRWVELASRDALAREGALMKHCVASYADRVIAGRTTIYSLRDPKNTPKLTVEARLQPQHVSLEQIKSFANQPCPADLLPAAAEFSTAFEELHAARPIVFSVEIQAAGFTIVQDFGLCVRGAPMPPKKRKIFAQQLANPRPPHSEDEWPLLMSLVHLDDAELLALAMPHASQSQAEAAINLAAVNANSLAVKSRLGVSLKPKCLLLFIERIKANNIQFPKAPPPRDEWPLLLSLVHLDEVQLLAFAMPRASQSQVDSALDLAAFISTQRALFKSKDTPFPRIECLPLFIELIKSNRIQFPKSRHLGDEWPLLASLVHLDEIELLAFAMPLAAPSQAQSVINLAASLDNIKCLSLLIRISGLSRLNPTPLFYAATYGNTEAMKLILAASPRADLSDPLRHAARAGHAECVKLLLSACHDASSIDEPVLIDKHPLQCAAKGGHAECVKLLIPFSDPKLECSEPLRLAAENGHHECVELLIPFSDPMAGDARAFGFAARNGHLECVLLLAPFINSRAAYIEAIEMAIENKRLDVAKHLLFILGRPHAPLNIPRLRNLALRASEEMADMVEAWISCPPLAATGAQISSGDTERALVLPSIASGKEATAIEECPSNTRRSMAPKNL